MKIPKKVLTPEQFKRIRVNKGYSVEELADTMGYSRHAIYKKEKREGRISLPDTVFLINLHSKNGSGKVARKESLNGKGK